MVAHGRTSFKCRPCEVAKQTDERCRRCSPSRLDRGWVMSSRTALFDARHGAKEQLTLLSKDQRNSVAATLWHWPFCFPLPEPAENSCASFIIRPRSRDLRFSRVVAQMH